MPVEDGYTLIAKVRALESDRGKYLPAIALTAYAREVDREQAIAAGFQKHLSKPVEPDELVAVVANLLGK
jgi:CheY-like chemotaxis protein